MGFADALPEEVRYLSRVHQRELMVDQLTGGIDEMFSDTTHVKHRGDKENDQAEKQKIKSNSSGNRRLPEPTV